MVFCNLKIRDDSWDDRLSDRTKPQTCGTDTDSKSSNSKIRGAARKMRTVENPTLFPILNGSSDRFQKQRK